MKHYDLAVIGGGAGMMVLGPALAHGLSCAIVERSAFGGTCLNRGCIPSKMLVYPADLIREAQTSKRVGVDFGRPVADWSLIASRMWAQIEKSKTIERSLKMAKGLDVYNGVAGFSDAHTLVITSDKKTETIRAEKLVVASGSRSANLPVEGLEATGYLTYENFFGDRFPKKLWDKLIIIGCGAIGAEFAHIFSALGTKVTVVELMPHVLPTEEEEISDFVKQQFQKNEIEVFTNHKLIFAGHDGRTKTVVIEDGATGDKTKLFADEIFVAAGLRPHADVLDLATAGIETDARGWIKTNDYLETSQPHIWALGDINGKYQLRHKANYEAGIVANNLLGHHEKKKAHYDAVPWAIYTWPQIGHVGMTEREARQQGRDIQIGRNRYADVIGGIAMGYDKSSPDNGFVKIITDKDHKILGAHVVGPQAAILVQPFAYLMNAGYKCDPSVLYDLGQNEHLRKLCRQAGTPQPILDAMVIHPSLNELTAWALEGIDWS